ncbi:hypothetical protein [Mesorhizobium sp. 2RAF21]|uniref:hypothetical protein n=1 Tax=Mesorhizobium sp. 2RAF21 TaxID=3232995 RepID=UPI003F9D9ACB
MKRSSTAPDWAINNISTACATSARQVYPEGAEFDFDFAGEVLLLELSVSAADKSTDHLADMRTSRQLSHAFAI